jgi:phosphate transport system protein
MRSRFDEQLSLLNRELIQMGAYCEEAIADTAKALLGGDHDMIARVAALEEEINRSERSIETLCLKLLLQQQPVARDLRQISAALKMITDMERIGDQAADIAEIVRHFEGRSGAECRPIGDMARATIHMVTDSVEAFVRQDIELAAAVIRDDDTVDELFRKTRDELIARIAEKPEDGAYTMDIQMIAKYFERIGDHATNIAEWVVFSATGVHKGEEEL